MIGRVTTAFAKFDGVDRNRFGGCFSPLGNQIRFRLLSPLRADCFNHLTCLWRVCAKWKRVSRYLDVPSWSPTANEACQYPRSKDGLSVS